MVAIEEAEGLLPDSDGEAPVDANDERVVAESSDDDGLESLAVAVAPEPLAHSSAPATPPEPVASSSAELDRVVVTPANCITELAGAGTRAEILEALPAFDVTQSWFVVERSEPGRRIAKIRSIMGTCMESECLVHRGGCKLMVNIRGRFEAADATLIRWSIAGTAMTMAQHEAASADVAAEWERSL